MKTNPAPMVVKASPAGKQFPLSGEHQPLDQQFASPSNLGKNKEADPMVATTASGTPSMSMGMSSSTSSM